jgi:hypothetical protein
MGTLMYSVCFLLSFVSLGRADEFQRRLAPNVPVLERGGGALLQISLAPFDAPRPGVDLRMRPEIDFN